MNMAFPVIVVITFLTGAAFVQSTTPTTTSTTTEPSTTPTTWQDPFAGGKSNNPGARAFVCKKSMDAIHEYASDMIARAIRAMTVPDLSLSVGLGTLIVKPPRVTEASYAKTDYNMIPPNKISSRFYDGRLVANGIWQFKPNMGDMIGGTYKAMFHGAELNSTNQLGRTPEAKPMVQMVDCKANLSKFRIEVQGSSQIKEIEDCDMELCVKIRKYFEDIICRLFEGFIKEVINRELQLVPTRMCIQGDQYKVEYGLMYNDPITVNDTDKCIRAGMEGKYNWRGLSGVPFNPVEMQWENRNRMYSFQIGDYTFNTLLHQAHYSGHRFSASELLESSSIKDMLRLNCDGSTMTTTTESTTTTTSTTTTPKPTKPSARKYSGLAMAFKSRKVEKAPEKVARKEEHDGYDSGASDIYGSMPKCLGSLFSNFSNFGPYSATDMGDIVFKSTQKAPAIFVDSEKRAFFDVSSGTVAFYGPVGSNGNRPLLAQGDIRFMRGEFFPKLNKANITGSIKLDTVQLVQPSSRMITPEWLTHAGQFVTPILTESFNTFFDQYAQFPLPLRKRYQCASPQFSVLARTMQLDCDIEYSKNGGDSSSSTEGSSEGEGDEAHCTCFRDTCVC